MTASPYSPLSAGANTRRTRQVISDSTLGWAIVGASSMARRNVVPAIRNQPPLAEEDVRYPVSSSVVVGVFSRDAARARMFADQAFIPHAFVNLTDLIERQDVHCVYVGGHPRHHMQVTLAALVAGKHVLCETPMALSLEEATAMAHTAASAGLRLGVNYVRRADPAVQTMREMVVRREIGDVLGARVTNMTLLEPALQTWRLLPGGGGAVLHRVVHSVDLVRYLLRDEIASVYGRSTLQILSNVVEEDVTSQLEMRRTGRIVELRDSFLVPHNATRLEIFGSAGTLVANNCFVDEPDSELLLIQNQRQIEVPLEPSNPYVEAVRRFNQAVRDAGQPLAGSGDGVNNLTVSLAIQESAKLGRKLVIPSADRQVDDHSVI
jgi:1,5-anhydro-D-fructose reductase (1,5-anhydro-D-mannitol-forming)